MQKEETEGGVSGVTGMTGYERAKGWLNTAVEGGKEIDDGERERERETEAGWTECWG